MSWQFQLLSKPQGGISEGPVWDGEALYYTHIQASRILRFEPKTEEITEARGGTNRTNGLCYDAEGRLFGCCSGGRAIVRFDPDGSTKTIADRFQDPQALLAFIAGVIRQEKAVRLLAAAAHAAPELV